MTRDLPKALVDELTAYTRDAEAWTSRHEAAHDERGALDAGLVAGAARAALLERDIRDAVDGYCRGRTTSAAVIGAVAAARGFFARPLFAEEVAS